MVAALLAMVLLGACAPAQAGYDPNQPPTGPMTALPDCGPLPDPVEDARSDGAPLPDGAVVTSTVPQGPLVNVTAEVPLTPVNIRLAYEARDDLELIIVEDEVFETELLVSDGTNRTYIKASATCATGSTLLAVIAPEDDPAGAPLPVPSAAAAAEPGQ